MMDKLTDKQWHIDQWLSRMDDHNGELVQLYTRRDDIISSMSGIGSYDAEKVHGGSDPNPTEAKNIEYVSICSRIEKIERKIAIENARTLDVINKVSDSKLRGMMIGRYINHLSWKKVGEMYYYGRSSSYNYRGACLNAIASFIPKEAFIEKNKFSSQKDWTLLD